MYNHYIKINNYSVMAIILLHELILTLATLFRLLVSQLGNKLDCVASTALATDIISPICSISDFTTTTTTEFIESSESIDDDWDDDDDDDLLDDDDDDEEEPDDKDLEDEDQDDLDDDDDEEIF